MTPTTPRPFAALALAVALSGGPPAAAAPVPKADPPAGRVVFLAAGEDGVRLQAVTPDGTDAGTLVRFAKGEWADGLRLSRDGARAAVYVVAPRPADATTSAGEVRVYDLAKPGKPVATLAAGLAPGIAGGGPWQNAVELAWGADADTVYVTRTTKPADVTAGTAGRTWTVTRYAVATGKGTPVALPPAYTVVDVTADGKTLLLESVTPYPGPCLGYDHATHLADAATLKVTATTKFFAPYRFSPDGRQVLGLRVPEQDAYRRRLAVLDPAAGTVAELPLGGDQLGYRPEATWSADGKRLLVSRAVRATGEEAKKQPDAYVPVTGELFTCDPDGGNRKGLLSKEQTAGRGPWTAFDWR